MKATTLAGLPHVTPGRTTRTVSRLSIALDSAGTVLTGPGAEARITLIEITSVQSPTFEGRVFGPSGSVGAYEKLAKEGSLLPDDVQQYIEAAQASDVLR